MPRTTKLRLLLQRLTRHRFGTRSEPLTAEQLQFGLEGAEQTAAEHDACPCCGGAMHSIGEVRTEQLDMVPMQLRVRVTRRPRYACRTCEGAVVMAEAPSRPIDGGLPTEALIVNIVVGKFCDSLPLYRQRLLVVEAALRSGGQHRAVVRQGVRRRHRVAGARPGPWPDQEGRSLVLRGR